MRERHLYESRDLDASDRAGSDLAQPTDDFLELGETLAQRLNPQHHGAPPRGRAGIPAERAERAESRGSGKAQDLELGLLARVSGQKAPPAGDDLEAQRRGRSVENHQVDAGNERAEAAAQLALRVPIEGRVEEHCDIDVAQRPRAAACGRAEAIDEPHARFGRQQLDHSPLPRHGNRSVLVMVTRAESLAKRESIVT